MCRQTKRCQPARYFPAGPDHYSRERVVTGCTRRGNHRTRWKQPSDSQRLRRRSAGGVCSRPRTSRLGAVIAYSRSEVHHRCPGGSQLRRPIHPRGFAVGCRRIAERHRAFGHRRTVGDHRRQRYAVPEATEEDESARVVVVFVAARATGSPSPAATPSIDQANPRAQFRMAEENK
jgi:hypothetical protein